jgi:hypothetical protein
MPDSGGGIFDLHQAPMAATVDRSVVIALPFDDTMEKLLGQAIFRRAGMSVSRLADSSEIGSGDRWPASCRGNYAGAKNIAGLLLNPQALGLCCEFCN